MNFKSDRVNNLSKLRIVETDKISNLFLNVYIHGKPVLRDSCVIMVQRGVPIFPRSAFAILSSSRRKLDKTRLNICADAECLKNEYEM